jgi:hypothetical protein
MWDIPEKDLIDRDHEEEVNGWAQNHVHRQTLLSAVVNLQVLLRSWRYTYYHALFTSALNRDGHSASRSCLLTS